MAFKDIYFPQLDLLWNVPNDYADDLSFSGRTLSFHGPGAFSVDHVDFNGTTDWLDIDPGGGNGAGQFATDDFTIENIVRFSNLTGTQYLYTNNFGTPGTTLKVYLTGGNITVEIGGVVKASFAATAGVDYNWALCRSGTDMRFFVNGVQQGATWTSAASFDAQQFRLGADSAGANRFVGRQYGMRVTRFAGRYSANYTSTTVANLVAGDWPNFVRIIQGHVFKADGTPASYKVRACLASEYDAMSTTHALPLIYSAFSTSGTGAFSFVVRSSEELVVMVDHNTSIFDDPATIRNHKIMRVDPTA